MWIDDRNPDVIVVYQHQPSDFFVKKMYWDTERQGWVLERNVTPLVIARDWLRRLRARNVWMTAKTFCATA